MIRKIALAMAVIMLVSMLGVVALARGSYLGSLKVVNCQSWVTLRRYPSTSADSVTKVPLGAWVEAYAYNSEFTECYYNGLHGYILSSYLSGYATDYAQMRVVNCREFVTLRARPSTSAASLTKVPLGQVVEAYYYNSEFYRCYYRGLEGYILSSYLMPAY